MLKDYEHNAKYYETDQMGCVHHSITSVGWRRPGGPDGSDGLRLPGHGGSWRGSPVLKVNCRYKSMVRFGDTVRIHAWIKEGNGIRMTIGTSARRLLRELRTQAESAHCFPHTGPAPYP